MTLPVDLRRLIPIAAIGVVAIVAAVLVARGLGGSSSTPSSGPSQTIDQAFGASAPSSGKFELTAAVALQGAPSAAANPFGLEAAGAFQKGASGAPAKVKVDATVSAAGQKQSFTFVSDGRQAVLTRGGQVQQIPAGNGTTSFAVDPRGWLKNPVEAPQAQVDGVTTDHVTADVDVQKMFADLQAAAPQSGVAGQTGLAGDAQKSLRDAVKDARADIYTGASDHVLRRLTVTGTISADSPVGGKVGGNLVFDLRITDVNQPQSIKVPGATPAKPAKPAKHAPKPAPRHTGTAKKQAARQGRSAQGYVTCVTAAGNLQALQRCQALVPKR